MRIRFFDSFKGALILSVIIAHAAVSMEVRRALFTFVVPGFVFVSGIFLNRHLLLTPLDFWKKKIRTLLIPYFSIGLFSYFFWLCLHWFWKNDVDTFKPLLGLIYGNGHDGWLAMNTPLWFLTCLFSTELLFFYLNRLLPKKFLFASVFAFTIFGIFNSLTPLLSFRLPFGLDMAFYLLLPLFLGSQVKITDPTPNPSSLLSFLGLILFIPTMYWIGAWNGGFDVNFNFLGGAFSAPFFAWIVSAFLSLTLIPFSLLKIFQYLYIPRRLENFLVFLGVNSLYFFSLHMLTFDLSELFQQITGFHLFYEPLLDLVVSLTSISFFLFVKDKIVRKTESF